MSAVTIAQGLHAKKYRADIDGLRAIAVSSVLLCHALPSALPGGFIGVDIFFVISGYLITLILIGDLDKNRFSIIRFYDRRVRRIFPALITVILFTWVVGWALLFRPEFATLGRHIVASTLFSENLILWGESSYFDVSSHQKMLMHLWSLAIEEQFYIFWPLLMLLSARRSIPFVPMLCVLGVTSFAVNLYDIQYNPTASYYSPAGRVWELMVGAALAWITAKHPEYLNRWSDLRSVSGMLLILVALLCINPSRAFPGIWALLPTMGTFLLISAGGGAWLNRKVLSSTPFVWCGLISYPLYLWHWPLLSFTYVIAGTVSMPKGLLAIALSVLAATGTFLLIERPLRLRGADRRQTPILVAVMVVVGLLGCAAMWSLVLPRLSEFKAPTRTEWDFLLQRVKNSDKNFNGIYPIFANRTHSTIVIGDSHVAQYAQRLSRILESKVNRGVVFVVGGGCTPIRGTQNEAIERRGCGALLEDGFKLAAQKRFDTVVFGGSWTRLFTDNDKKVYFDVNGVKVSIGSKVGRKLAFERLAQQIGHFRSEGKRVFLVLDEPVGSAFDPSGLAARLSFSATNFKPNRFVKVDPAQIVLHEEMRLLASRAGAIVIDPWPAFCRRGNCLATDRMGLPIYKDATHFNPDWIINQASFIDPTVSDND